MRKSMEAKDEQAEEVARIRERIDALITAHFGKGAPCYYLSQLGNELGEDRKLLEKLTRMKVSQFVAKEFGFEIGRTGTHQNVLYLVAPGGGAEPPPVAAPRYNSRFWTAFAVPLPEGERRYIELAEFEFGTDAEALAASGGEVREITADFLTKVDQPRTPAQIAERITAWLETQKLDVADFLLQKRRRAREGNSLLDRLLSALDKEQLKRTNLPLDVIRSLDARRD
jgi:DNA primase